MNLKVDEWGRGGEGQGMVVTRQGKMSGRLWVDVDVDIVFVDDMVVVVFIVGDAFDFVLLMFLFLGMVVTRQGKMSRRLWVDDVIVIVVER